MVEHGLSNIHIYEAHETKSSVYMNVICFARMAIVMFVLAFLVHRIELSLITL